MNTSLFIANKLGEERKSGSRVVRISSMIVVGSVALSISVIIIALSIVSGYRKDIRERAIGFTGEMILSPFGIDYMNDSYPLSMESSYLPMVSESKNVSHMQRFAFKHGLIKTGEALQGIVIKGVGKEFDPSFLASHLSEGSFPLWSDSTELLALLISKRMSESLKLEVSHDVLVYFIDPNQQTTSVRRFTISGIYDAALEELDQSLAIGDIRVVQRLNGWKPEQVGGIELFLHHPGQMERTASEIEEIMARHAQLDDSSLSVRTVKELFSHLFDWLNLLDMNMLIVLVLMIAVAGVNMISGLLIHLFDKTSMIGLLKSLGMTNGAIRLTFIYRMGRLILKGILIGNAIALILCLIQKKFTIITLDQTNYAVSSVPININIWSIMFMNILSLLLIFAFMLLASTMITHISPERSLRVK